MRVRVSTERSPLGLEMKTTPEHTPHPRKGTLAAGWAARTGIWGGLSRWERRGRQGAAARLATQQDGQGPSHTHLWPAGGGAQSGLHAQVPLSPLAPGPCTSPAHGPRPLLLQPAGSTKQSSAGCGAGCCSRPGRSQGHEWPGQRTALSTGWRLDPGLLCAQTTHHRQWPARQEACEDPHPDPASHRPRA